ncbi:PadR family transcriptional regulator [Mycolicibacterium madagascariense]|uniref:PadR family transcriptional regulator n=1 Tax=Mycolicibacterium madagascariense TaxID=212765 RepID=UPI0013D4E421|nr:PadR family transcriptional regulator [Mycolicibacterium madagascariense]MCV7015639.1 PadR family transcriptional regulator [Mycolicibacterium madagascariense]
MSLRFAALGLLAQHPGSGYDLLRRFEQSMANVWPATQSQLYGELNKLAADGLIEVTDVGPRGRKEYQVTAAGRTELVRWMTHPGDDPPHRSASLLRVFLLGEIPPEKARQHLVGVAAHAESELARLTELRDSLTPWGDSAAEFFGGAALDYGLRIAQMEGDWARSLVSAFDERQTETSTVQ